MKTPKEITRSQFLLCREEASLGVQASGLFWIAEMDWFFQFDESAEFFELIDYAGRGL
jgi:hypothetical protein